MKQSSLLKFRPVLFISIAVLVIWMGIGNYQNAAAASTQTHEQTGVESPDISAYRWEASAGYYISNQVWPQRDLTTFSAADISAYRWEAMAMNYPAKDLTDYTAADAYAYRWEAMGKYYMSHQVMSDKDLTALKSDHRLVMIESGFWARTASLLY